VRHSRLKIFGIGAGCRCLLPEACADLAGESVGRLRVVAVVGSTFATRPWRDSVLRELGRARCSVYAYHGDSSPDGVARLARHLAGAQPSLVVAIGGGTVLDVSKAAAALGRRADLDADLDADLVRAACAGQAGELTRPGFPLLAIPTTPGTGAEATPFATVWDRPGNRKLSLAGEALRPAGVLLDPELLIGVPPRHLTAGALDSMAQGSESSWSVRSTSQSIMTGLSAVQLAAEGLAALPGAGDGAAGRPSPATYAKLQLAGHYSGLGISEVPTSSCHALSYPLTLRYRLPHGIACGLALGPLLRLNADTDSGSCADARGPEFVRRAVSDIVSALGARSARAAASWLREHGTRFARPALPLSLSSLEDIAADALGYQRIFDNPRKLDQDAIVGVLQALAE
jgi:alcohol dehydrogenase class IV